MIIKIITIIILIIHLSDVLEWLIHRDCELSYGERERETERNYFNHSTNSRRYSAIEFKFRTELGTNFQRKRDVQLIDGPCPSLPGATSALAQVCMSELFSEWFLISKLTALMNECMSCVWTSDVNHNLLLNFVLFLNQIVNLTLQCVSLLLSTLISTQRIQKTIRFRVSFGKSSFDLISINHSLNTHYLNCE